MPAPRLLTGWIDRTTRRRVIGTRWPDTLDRSRLFILPTAFGVLAGASTLVLLMVALNYQNSPVFLLTFLFGALLCVAMVACHRHLIGLQVRGVEAPPVFAGDPLRLRISLHNPHRRPRRGLVCYAGTRHSNEITLEPGGSGQLELVLAPRPRGHHVVRGPGLASSEPFGVFHAWCRLVPIHSIVYPRPADHAGTPPGTGEGESRGGENPQPEDFAGLAPYRPGDRPGQIAWRTYARGGILERKHFTSGGSGARWLDFEAAPGPDHETRLSVLARWALNAERDGSHWGLRLPGHTIPPDRGSAHLAGCLRAMALFPGPYDDS